MHQLLQKTCKALINNKLHLIGSSEWLIAFTEHLNDLSEGLISSTEYLSAFSERLKWSSNFLSDPTECFTGSYV